MFHGGRPRCFRIALAATLFAVFLISSGAGADTASLTTPPPELSFSLRDDLAGWPARLWAKARRVPSWENGQVLSLGGGWAYVASADWDDDVREDTAVNYRRMGEWNDLFSVAGHPAIHIGAAALLYSGSLFAQSSRLHGFSTDLIDALVLTDVSNVSLKHVFDSDRPNGEPLGFPSGHTASSFAAASVVESHFGLFPGLLAYALAGAVGWHRIDARKHELSDVLGGAAIGYVIGKSATGKSLLSSGDVRIVPYSDPHGGGTGIGIAWSF